MRAALWLLALFGVAVAAALFAGNNQGTVTLFWPPYRVDLSLNMVVLALVLGFVTLYAALRALAALLELPHQARHWRLQQKERAMHAALLDALTQLLAGRFLRSRKAALAALEQEQALDKAGAPAPQGPQPRAPAPMAGPETSPARPDAAPRPPAGQAPCVFGRCGAQHRARPGHGADQQRPRSLATAGHLAIVRSHRPRHA